MEMHAVDSSLIARYGFDPDKLFLDLEFNQGGTYRYKGVTPERFSEFLQSASKGKHFLAKIKGKYEWEKR